MPLSSIALRILLGTGQTVLPLGCLAAIAFTPPAQGRMLLVPTSAEAGAALVAVAIRHGARLVESGPISGSMVVEGVRQNLVTASLRHGILPLRAQRGGCTDVKGTKP